jgi:hypothetical protein
MLTSSVFSKGYSSCPEKGIVDGFEDPRIPTGEQVSSTQIDQGLLFVVQWNSRDNRQQVFTARTATTLSTIKPLPLPNTFTSYT